MNRFLCTALLSMTATLFAVNGYAQVSPYRFSPPVLSIDDADMDTVEAASGILVGGYDPFIDVPITMLRMPDDSQLFFHQSVLHYSLHQGTISGDDWFDNVIYNIFFPSAGSADNPFKNRFNGLQWPASSTFPSTDLPYDQKEFLMGVYKVNDNELLGFVHVERTHSSFIVPATPGNPNANPPIPSVPAHPQSVSEYGDRLFAIGLAWSVDTGDGWTEWEYAGDVILPNFDGYNDGLSSNIGGVPYVIDGNNLYMYYNEAVPAGTGGPRRYNSVVSAPLDRVVSDARDGFVDLSYWGKLHNDTFSESTITGVGDPILPTGTQFLDLHSTAAYCSATGEYILTAPANPDVNDSRSIYLFSSPDGIHNWTQRGLIDRRVSPRTFNTDLEYAGIVSEFGGASDDNHVVGDEFYIMYAERRFYPQPTLPETDVYYVRVNSSDPCADASHIMGFEDTSEWSIIAGSGTLSNNAVQTTLGTSMEMSGNGWQQIRSAPFSTTCLTDVDDTLTLDLFVGNTQPNPWWIGNVQLYVHCPSANVYNYYIGQAMLSDLTQGRFNDVTFSLPSHIVDLLRGDHPDFSWSIALSTNSGSGPYYLDSMRF